MSLVYYLQAHPVAFLALIGVLGLMVGSFLNVVIARLPVIMEREWRTQCAELDAAEPGEEEPERFNLMVPRSRCPHCGHGITALENIPVLSYLVLRGRCSSCGAGISPRYPIIEILGALLAVSVAWRFGFGLQAAAAVVLTWALISLSFIDIDHQLLPDSITLPLLWLGITLNLFGVFTTLEASVIGAMAGYLVLWSIYHLFKLLTGKEGMGYGDFKLLAVLGAWMGWQALPVIVLLSSVVGAVVGIALMALRGHDRNVPIPFGPYIALAGWIALLWGDELVRIYLNLGAHA